MEKIKNVDTPMLGKIPSNISLEDENNNIKLQETDKNENKESIKYPNFVTYSPKLNSSNSSHNFISYNEKIKNILSQYSIVNSKDNQNSKFISEDWLINGTKDSTEENQFTLTEQQEKQESILSSPKLSTITDSPKLSEEILLNSSQHSELPQYSISQEISQFPSISKSLVNVPISQQTITQENLSQKNLSLQENLSQQTITQENLSQQTITQENLSQKNLSLQENLSQKKISQQSTLRQIPIKYPSVPQYPINNNQQQASIQSQFNQIISYIQKQEQQKQEQNNIQLQMKDSINQFMDKILKQMENLEKRLNNLEITTNMIWKKQIEEKHDNLEEVLVKNELEQMKKIQEQIEKDTEIAKKLQAEINAKGNSQLPNHNIEKKNKLVSIPKKEMKLEQCPICQVQVPQCELEVHVNKCLDTTPTKKETEKLNEEQQSSLWNRMFNSKKKEDTLEEGVNMYDLNKIPPPNSLPNTINNKPQQVINKTPNLQPSYPSQNPPSQNPPSQNPPSQLNNPPYYPQIVYSQGRPSYPQTTTPSNYPYPMIPPPLYYYVPNTSQTQPPPPSSQQK